MKKLCLVLAVTLIAGCGGGEEEAGGLTASERQRLENIAERLDEERAEVRELLEANEAVSAESQPGSNRAGE